MVNQLESAVSQQFNWKDFMTSNFVSAFLGFAFAWLTILIKYWIDDKKQKQRAEKETNEIKKMLDAEIDENTKRINYNLSDTVKHRGESIEYYKCLSTVMGELFRIKAPQLKISSEDLKSYLYIYEKFNDINNRINLIQEFHKSTVNVNHVKGLMKDDLRHLQEEANKIIIE